MTSSTGTKILLVDDEKKILNACKRVLRKEPFTVDATTSPEEALRKIALTRYAVVISDQRMPSMVGTELLERVRHISADTIRIILTGYADIHAAVDAINRGAVYRFLAKPWNDDELRQTVRQAVSQYELVIENRRLQKLTEKQNVELKELNESLESKVEERTAEVSRLNQELQKSFLGSVQVLAGLAELHSTVIGYHAKRVAELSKEVAQRMGLSGKDLFLLEVAATLHDIGKVGVPAEILRKPEGELQPNERRLLQGHVVQGVAIVKMVPNLGEVCRIIRHHHECFDGSGYPDGLKGEEIPLASRIVAAVDAYDRALNTRAFFKSATPEEALDFVKIHTPRRFHPEVVAALIKCVSQGRRALDEDIEVEIHPRDLRAGMVLSRDLMTAKGIKLLPQGGVVKPDHVSRILNYQESDPVVEGVYVYRRSPAPSPAVPAG